MATTRKKPIKQPGDGDGGARVERASDKPTRRVDGSKEPMWLSPRAALPPGIRIPTPEDGASNTIIDKALALFPDVKSLAEDPDKSLLAAVLIAQALDRLGKQIATALVEAAAITRRPS
jgi:hypothetical protein